MDLTKLTDAQLDVAEKIAKKAKDRGLNPDFVLPMVMAESEFNQDAKSKRGAVGVMQIMPTTADFYKCKDPTDLDQNIDCGLTILTDLVSKKKIGNDPYKVLAGYNAGPNTKYFTSGNIEDLRDETINHMEKVSGFYGGSLPLVSGEKPEKDESVAKATDGATDGTQIKDPKDEIKDPPKGLDNQTDPYAVVGGVTGASVASSLE
ncbi:MAG: hypothetical protein EBS66_15515, partial [Betaproteobacteria bacterium]|nr:hypothetical protein [Betaproteobacteria bacterium]